MGSDSMSTTEWSLAAKSRRVVRGLGPRHCFPKARSWSPLRNARRTVAISEDGPYVTFGIISSLKYFAPEMHFQLTTEEVVLQRVSQHPKTPPTHLQKSTHNTQPDYLLIPHWQEEHK